MSTTFPDVAAELKAAAIAAVSLPAAPAGSLNVLTTIQGARRSFVEQLREPSARLSLPMLILELGDYMTDPSGAANSYNIARMPTSVYYLLPRGPLGNQGLVSAGLVLIKSALDSPTSRFTHFCPIEEGQILTDTDSPINKALLVDAQVDVIAGCLRYAPGLRVALY